MNPISRRTFLKQSGGLTAASLAGPAFLLTPVLPRVLIIGDSISIGYMPFVREILAGKAELFRPMKDAETAENCQGTTHGVERIDAWIGDTEWDVIHFNFGLHDIKHVDPITRKNSKNLKHPQQAPPRQYKKNLVQIMNRLQATKAKLIFATTTPYPAVTNGPLRLPGQPKRYNKIATKLMRKQDIPINDLHAFVLPRMAELQRPANVHFTETGSRALAQQVADAILQTLSS